LALKLGGGRRHILWSAAGNHKRM